jgi:hypothetical protein
MRKLLFIGAVVAPVLFAAGGASACCDCDGASYGYTYGYAAPRVYGYSSYYAPTYGYGSYYSPAHGYGYGYGGYYRPAYGYSSYYRSGVRFYGARTYGWRGGVGVRRVGWGGRGRW